MQFWLHTGSAGTRGGSLLRNGESRVAVLTKLDAVKDKALEKVVQKHIFDNLWMLDPSWERASVDEAMEVTVRKAFKKVTAGLTDKQKKARLDISSIGRPQART
jgi:hypothetical protein